MLVDFIIPTYDRLNFLRCMLSSLVVQTNSRWRANVVIDDVENNDILKVIKDIDHNNIRYTFTEKRYNDFGHTPREMGKQMSECKYVIMTGDDNYYTPNFVNEIEIAALSNPGMIYWDMVHFHYNYSYFQCRPILNQIDMGAFATRADLAKQITLSSAYAADGIYVGDFKKKFPNEEMMKINKVLFVHN